MTLVGGHRTDPPRLAERLLERVVPNAVARVGLTGDLREAFLERRLTRGWWLCAMWYWRQVLAACLRYGLARLVDARRSPPRSRRRARAEPSHQERSGMGVIVQDIRYTLRRLRKAPAMTTISILMLTLGIGMPTIMFTVVDGVFQDLPVEQPERVLRLFYTHPQRGGQQEFISHHDFVDWRSQQSSFEDLAGFSTEDVTVSGGDARPVRLNAAFVTPNVLDVLGVRPLIGRSFLVDDAAPGAAVAIVSYGIWQSQFGADPNALGRTLVVDGERYAVVGVMPDRFGFPTNHDIWIPLTLSHDVARADSPTLEVFGRLRDGVSVDQARSELRTMAARLAVEYPETNRERSASVARYGEGLIDPNFARGLYTMLGAVSFVLLIACVNVANLLLARAISRSREIALRSALGASRGRIITQFLLESLLIASAGGVLGATVAWLGVRLFNQTLTAFVGLSWVEIRVDGMVLVFVIGVVLLTALLAGALPALQASGVNMNTALHDAPRGAASPGLRIGRLGRGLVMLEVALSCALLVVSGLLIKGVLKLRAIDLGMPVAEIVTGEVELPRQVYPTPESRVRFFEDLETSVSAIPGVTNAALMSDIPGTIGFSIRVQVEGEIDGAEQTTRVGALTVTPSFLDVLGATLIDGRGFAAQDRAGSDPVVVINRSFADQFFPDRRPIGRAVQVGSVRRTVVGVVPDLFMGRMEEPGANGPGLYVPLAQSSNVSMQLFVRTAQDPLTVTDQVRDVLEALDPTLAMMDVDRVDHLIARRTVVFDIFGRLFLFFGLVALFLAATGLYGVMMFTVHQRTREWGVRMALGAKATDVVRLATRQATVQLVVGLSIGLVIAGVLSRPLASFFYQVEPWDLTIFATIVALLSLTGVVAALAPAYRATKVDPLTALQYE